MKGGAGKDVYFFLFRGIENAWPWRHAWKWRDSELFIILEDDTELSPHWYRAIVNMWTRYSSHPHMSGARIFHTGWIAVKEYSNQ